jgi:hypothetical protein
MVVLALRGYLSAVLLDLAAVVLLMLGSPARGP